MSLALELGVPQAPVPLLPNLAHSPVAMQEPVLFAESVDGREPVTERGLRAPHCRAGRRDGVLTDQER